MAAYFSKVNKITRCLYTISFTEPLRAKLVEKSLAEPTIMFKSVLEELEAFMHVLKSV